MAIRHGLAEASVAERLEAVLGGAPMPAADLADGKHEKHARKRRKQEARQRRNPPLA